MTYIAEEHERNVALSMIQSEKFRAVALTELTEKAFATQWRKIYEAVRELVIENRPIDAVTVGQSCGMSAAKLSEAMDVISPTQARYEIKELVMLSYLRRFRGWPVVDQIVTGSDRTADAYARVIEYVEEATKIESASHSVHISTACKAAIDEMKSRGTAARGIVTGFPDVDAFVTGFRPGNYVVIGARPSMGKTAFAMSIARNMADAGNPGLIMSCEMTDRELGMRVLSDVADAHFYHLQIGNVAPERMDVLNTAATETLKPLPLFVDDTPGWEIEELCMRIRLETMKRGLKFVVIDHMAFLHSGKQRYNGKNAEYGYISKRLKQTAKQLGIVIILVSQLNRDTAKGDRPTMADIRDCGEIEQDADIILLLYREEYYNPDTTNKDIIEIITGKNRNGPTGTAKLIFKRDRMRFLSIVSHGEHLDEEY